MAHYPFYTALDLRKVTQEVLQQWREHKTFEQSLQQNVKNPPRHFYEGPPGANGAPGIHHLLTRVLKDLCCRYYTMRGYYVARKSGWDAHGLPVELAVEKELGITKENIGKTITIEDYNKKCKDAVMRHQKEWEEVTEQVGYWLAMEHPYMTCDRDYISALWKVVQQLYQKKLLYKGFSIQPYSPAAGTALSTHELNQPGCYKEVKDTTIVAQFAVKHLPNTYLLAWTTTPWTLPANSALAVGRPIDYVCVATYNRYTALPIQVVLAKKAVPRYFDPQGETAPMRCTKGQLQPLPWRVVRGYTGSELLGWEYVQLLQYVTPEGSAFRVVEADFVTTEEGTGIVHIAPTFGSDDARLAAQANIPAVTVPDATGKPTPLVDKQGRFVQEVSDFAGAYVKEAYKPASVQENTELSVDIQIANKLKSENKAFLVATYTHTYPHCWRTDKPILYYPVTAWFIKTSAYRERLVALNQTIHWHPAATGEGRFGHWLEHVVDWNLTRSRFWGTPLPIWSTEDESERKCIGSIQELRREVDKSVAKGFMQHPLPQDFDPHRPYVDRVILVSKVGTKMYREPDVLDVWFDSGAMPYAQHGAAWSGGAQPPVNFPADFIVEGIDQTRGWFFTLHVLAVLLFDQVAFKNVLATGLVLDKQGNKMAKRLGNTIDPKELLDTYGADVVRWYMLTNSDPWENLKFDPSALQEIKNRFFDTLYNTYQFFALYANMAGFHGGHTSVDPGQGTPSDRWIMSKLQGLIKKVGQAYDTFAPTQAARAVQDFVVNDLSNWYVRLNRKRFWQAEDPKDKHVAPHTLYQCLTTVARLAAPAAPFYMERLYADLQQQRDYGSVHWTSFPSPESVYEDPLLEQQMAYAQQVCSLVHSLRKKALIKVRQPLSRILLPLSQQTPSLETVASLILAEVNVKQIDYVASDHSLVAKKIRPNLPRLGKQYGPQLAYITAALGRLSQEEIVTFEQQQHYDLQLAHSSLTSIPLTLEDVLITTCDIPGWSVATDGEVTVALDLTLTPELIAEGQAREFVKVLQNLRKEQGCTIGEIINVELACHNADLQAAITCYQEYVMKEAQIHSLTWVAQVPNGVVLEVNGASVVAKLMVNEQK